MPLLADKVEDDAIAFAYVNEEKIISITQNVNEILDSVNRYSPNDTENIQEALRASAIAVESLKDQLASLESIPSTVDSLFKMLTQELSNAEHHLKSIFRFVSDHYTHSNSKVVASIGAGQRILSSQESSSRTHPRKSSTSMADYYLRSQSRHLQRGNNIGKSYDAQQGYHPARQSRQGIGTQKHRRLDHDGQCSATPGDSTYGQIVKQEQCIRLAECAQNYNFYDFFIYFFGDDIDTDTGKIDENIFVTGDLYNITAKVRTVFHKMMCIPFDATMMLKF